MAERAGAETRSLRPDTSIVEIADLTFTYPGDSIPVLGDLCLSILRGSFTALVGHSGCGKSTLLSILAGYLAPERGTCRFETHPIQGPDPRRVPIFQVDSLLPWLRVRDNVSLSSRLNGPRQTSEKDHERVSTLLESVGLTRDDGIRYPKALSEGMKRRVEIARALYADAPMLLADEPFANLDMDGQAVLHELLLRVWREQKITILFTTHDLREALFLATSILVLTPERPSKAVGPFENLHQGRARADREDPDAYHALFDSIHEAMRSTLK